MEQLFFNNNKILRMRNKHMIFILYHFLNKNPVLDIFL